MNSLLGQSLVLCALGAAGFGSVVGWFAGARGSLKGLSIARTALYLFAAAMVLANLVMIGALVSHDFSVQYVAQVGSRSTPLYITIVSLWSALEGSILFWGAILGVYAAGFLYFNRHRHGREMTYAVATILSVGIFFALLIAGPANPFTAVPNPPTDGPGPNPLLQNHVLMIVHPPSLYLGYVGMTLPFAVAVGALLKGELNEGWLKVLRKTTLVAWTFLSFGIVLGGWWAYEVLGWGGYWAWDPVENASFLPWLAATGYLHSTVVQERRRMLKAWTLALVLGAFLLTILGTFMTRSGVFNSVHSFTQSPIGPLFLSFLALATIFSLGLLAGRSHLLEPEDRISAVLSRESAFLANNVIFAVFTFTVLLGTVFPLLSEAIRGVKLSVGEPYFNKMAVPVGLLLVFLMGVGPVLPWGRPDPKRLLRDFAIPTAAGVVAALGLLLAGLREPMAIATFGLCAFAMVVTVREMMGTVAARHRRRPDEGALAAVSAAVAGQRRKMGGYIVHLAVIVIVGSICGSQLYKQTADLALLPGQSAKVGSYKLTLLETTARDLPNKFQVVGRVHVERNGKDLGVLEPALTYYPTQREPVGTPFVTTIGHTDLYLSLMSVEEKTHQATIKAFVIPLVAYIWWCLPVIALGSLVALWPRRRALAALPAGEGATAS